MRAAEINQPINIIDDVAAEAEVRTAFEKIRFERKILKHRRVQPLDDGSPGFIGQPALAGDMNS